MDFKAGDTVSIKVKNPVWPMRKAYASYVHVPEFNEYTGTIIRNHKAIKDGQIGLTTGRHDFDMRVIDMDRIVSVNGDLNESLAVMAPVVKVWEIKGSRGSVYTVTDDNGRRECTCPGFTYRRDCRHIGEAA